MQALDADCDASLLAAHKDMRQPDMTISGSGPVGRTKRDDMMCRDARYSHGASLQGGFPLWLFTAVAKHATS